MGTPTTNTAPAREARVDFFAGCRQDLFTVPLSPSVCSTRKATNPVLLSGRGWVPPAANTPGSWHRSTVEGRGRDDPGLEAARNRGNVAGTLPGKHHSIPSFCPPLQTTHSIKPTREKPRLPTRNPSTMYTTLYTNKSTPKPRGLVEWDSLAGKIKKDTRKNGEKRKQAVPEIRLLLQR